MNKTLVAFVSHDFELYLNMDLVTLDKALLKNDEKSCTCLLKPDCLSSLGENGTTLLLLLKGEAAFEFGK